MKFSLLRDPALLAFILTVALLARVGFAYDQARKIPKAALAVAPFEQETGNIAYALATGKGFSNPFRRDTGPTAWLTPVYPLMVATSFKIFGIFTVTSFFALVFLNILFSTAVCLPVFAAGREIAGSAVGALGALLWAVFPGAVMVPFEWIWDTSLSALLAATLLWASLQVAHSDRVRDWCGYGLLWGFTLMTNPALGSLLPFLVGWAASQTRSRTMQSVAEQRPFDAWKKAAVALGLAAVCCLPWTLRNYLVFHRAVPLRSNFALELYIGNNENYDKHTRFPGPITKEREILRYFRLGEIVFMDEEMRKATKFMRSHPGEELVLFGERFAAFWSGLPNALHNFLETNSWLVRALVLWALVSGIGAAIGIFVLNRRRNAYVFPLAVYPAVFPILYYITHTSLRYRHPIDPAVLLLSAVTLHSAWRYSQTFWQPQGSNQKEG